MYACIPFGSLCEGKISVASGHKEENDLRIQARIGAGIPIHYM